MLLATQVLALRERHGARLPLVLMNSAVTRDPSLEVLRRYDGLRVPGLPLDFLQGREPKLRADNRQPVQWPADWSWKRRPPGHGDIYTALAASARSTPYSARGCATPSYPTPTISARSPTPGSPHG